MASVLISTLLSATIDWLPQIRSTPPSSSTIATVADDIERLERMLEWIKAVLVDAEERQIVDESVKLWLKEIKDVAYDAEDVLDEYQYEVLRAQVAAGATSEASGKRKRIEEVMTSASSGAILCSMTNRIKNIRERLDEISKDRDRFHLKPEDGQRRRDSSSEYPPPTTHMIIEQEICGRDDEKEELIDWLLSDTDSKFEVLAVVGKGGLGKTTLARLVYKDEEVKENFQHMIWICVSEDFDITRITREMIESITGVPCTMSQLSTLQTSVQEKLEGKTVLMVLDDVWDDKEESLKGLWESFIMPLKENGAEMVRIIVTTRNDSVAEFMQTTEKPYRLDCLPEDQCWELFLRHAFCGREQFPPLVEIGKKIEKKCDGLPLAIKSLGRLLQCETDEDDWKDVLQSQLWELDTEIIPALKLSYIRMPSHLKPCFEICSRFPKDYLFDKDELVDLWAAHRYIQHNSKEDDVKEKGYAYFNELHRRSFFDRFNNGDIAYTMHDSIHDLARYIQGEMDWSNNSKHKIRHLSIEKKFLKFNVLDLNVDDIGALRTLQVKVFGKNKIAINDMLRKNINLRYLLIKLECLEEEYMLPDGLGDLICLRHLELFIDADMKLPRSIGELYNLVMLDIHCDKLVEIPETLRNLVSLTTIRFYSFKNDKLPALGQLPSLRSLVLCGFKNVKSIGNEFYRSQDSSHLVAFPSLTSLVFLQLSNWEKWDDLQEGDFPRLQKLEIKSCERLSSLPSLGNLRLLSHVTLEECDSLQLSSFPPNLKTLETFRDKELSLPQGFGELKQLGRLRGKFGVIINEALEILKNLVSLNCLILSELERVHSEWNDKACLREYNSGIKKLVLNWSSAERKYISFGQEPVLHFVVGRDQNNGSLHSDTENALTYETGEFDDHEDEEDDDEFNQTNQERLFVLEKLQPHTDLEKLYIIRYYGVRCPSWIGHPSFFTLKKILLRSCKFDQLPSLGQLPSLEHLGLHSIYRLKRIGSEFCQDINNNPSHDAVAFPSLIKLKFNEMYCWEEWDGVRQGDFPKLESLSIYHCPRLSSVSVLRNLIANFDLTIYECPGINILVEESFPPNMKSLWCRNFETTKTCLSLVPELLKLESLDGVFRVRNNELFGILNNLPVDMEKLIITALKNVRNVTEAEANLKSLHRLASLTLKWSTDGDYVCDSLCLVVEDNDNDGTNQTENESFFLLEKLQPHIYLMELNIECYDSVGFPTWVGHTSFLTLEKVILRSCKIEQLPPLGQLPSLKHLRLCSIDGLKRIGADFCQGINSNHSHDAVAFPSLIKLKFKEMYCWEEWDGVRQGDFPKLQYLSIYDCPRLSSVPVTPRKSIPNSRPRRSSRRYVSYLFT